MAENHVTKHQPSSVSSELEWRLTNHQATAWRRNFGEIPRLPDWDTCGVSFYLISIMILPAVLLLSLLGLMSSCISLLLVSLSQLTTIMDFAYAMLGCRLRAPKGCYYTVLSESPVEALVSSLEQVHQGWDRPAPSGKNTLRLSQSTSPRGIDWHPPQASPQAGLKSTDLGTGSTDASVVSRARSHGGKAKTNFPTPTELHLDAVNIANMNNAAKLSATTNISNSHSSIVESSSPPSPLPLDLTLKTPLLSTGGGYFTAASGFHPLPASRELSFHERSPRETCRFDPARFIIISL
ncbi:hypothetical protein DVH24_037953 [Malus domestica]|uniref:Uncharacterized protein n=1 Tax=Malus domestica TaxID=3750 RepID=A0A498K378_MALDO|nr:hypothetical protein DVH24_037953 [Malus domestica]